MMEYVWAKGDECIAQYSGDGHWYEATIRKLSKNDRGQKVAWVKFSGYSSDENEEVKLSQLKPAASARKEQEKAATTPDKRNTSTLSRKAMFSPLQGDEEKTRLEEKFRVLEKEEEEERKTRTWDTTHKRLLDVPVRSSPRSTPRRKELIVTGGRAKETRQNRSRSQKSNCEPCDEEEEKEEEEGMTSTDGQRKSFIATSRKEIPITKPKMTNITLSDSDEDQPSDCKEKEKTKGEVNSPEKGFGESDLEKPNFSHAGCSPKERHLLSPAGTLPAVQIPATINQYLRDYQREGVAFMYQRYREGAGALLGDDMGLGKTVQVIAFMAAVLGKTGTKEDVYKQRPQFIRQMSTLDENETLDCEPREKKVFLVVGPASVLYNWVDELETWGHFSVGRYHKQYKAATLSELERDKLDVVVTTYETCRDNVETLNRFHWTAIIADEVHKIKSSACDTTVALKGFTCKRRIGLTGTALQNSMKELWCLLDWVNPKCLGNVVEFEEKFVKKIDKGLKQDATKRELAEARKAKDAFCTMRQQWMIRRTKAIIAHQLPKKDERVVFCKPTDLQVSVYKAILSHPDAQLIMHKDDPCRCGSDLPQSKCCRKNNSSGEPVGRLLFAFMHLLLKTSNHVALLLPDATSSDEQKTLSSDICRLALADHPSLLSTQHATSFRTMSDPRYCGKMKVLQGLLSVFLKERSKVLLFSLSTRLLDIIEHYVMSRGLDYSRLDGKTSEIRRVLLVREFNRDPDKFLLLASTKAGGVGLNMTGANVVIIFDPNWNPTHDLQAQDRAYRIGQGRNVRVFRLVCSGTIEENIYLRQIYKQQIEHVAVSTENARRYFVGVQGDRARRGELFGVSNIFALRTGDKCLTEDILQRHEKLEQNLKTFNIVKYIPRETAETTEQDAAEARHDEQTVEKTRKPAERSRANKQLPNSDSAQVDGGEDEVDDVYTQLMEDVEREPEHSGEPAADPMSPGQVNGASSTTKTSRKAKEGRTTDSPAAFDSSDEDKKLPKRLTKGVGKKSKPKERPTKEHQSEESPRRRETASFSSVLDVFKECGVVHTHDNRKVIGASRIEDHVSRCAIEDVYDKQQLSQVPAIQCDPLSESPGHGSNDPDSGSRGATAQTRGCRRESSRQVEKSSRSRGDCAEQPRTEVISGKKILIAQTPKGIREHQFTEMSSGLGYADRLSFAEAVLAAGAARRRHMLRTHYARCNADVAEAFDRSFEAAEQKKAQKDTNKSGREKKTRRPVKRPVRRPVRRKKGYQFDSEGSEDEMTQPVSLDRSREMAPPFDPPRNRRAEVAPLGTSRGTVAEAVEADTVTVDESVSESPVFGKRTRRDTVIRETRMSARDKDDAKSAGDPEKRVETGKKAVGGLRERGSGHVRCKLRRQGTMKDEDSDDMTTSFSTGTASQPENDGTVMFEDPKMNKEAPEIMDTVTVDEPSAVEERNLRPKSKILKMERRTAIGEEQNLKSTPAKCERTVSKARGDDESVDDFLDLILGNATQVKRKAPPPRRTPSKSPPKTWRGPPD